jgi:hypothetical protein
MVWEERGGGEQKDLLVRHRQRRSQKLLRRAITPGRERPPSLSAMALVVAAAVASACGGRTTTIGLAPDADVSVPATVPACTVGPCCTASGGLASNTTACATTPEYRCQGSSSCGGRPQQRLVQHHCSGASAACDGALEYGPWQSLAACEAEEICETNGASAPRCSACPFGCDRNGCLPQKLWLFETVGAFQGSLGGRAGADSRCAAARTAFHPSLMCNRVHALLGVSAADRLVDMAANHGVPELAPVHRASDGVLVSSNWADLVNASVPLIEVASTSTPADFWSGLQTKWTCDGWTSARAQPEAGGEGGDASVRNSWLSHAVHHCDRLLKLACLCWHVP